MRRLLAGLAIAVGLGMACGGPAYAGTGTSAPEEFGGMNAQWVFWGPQQTWAANLDAIAAGGVKTVRFDATWNTIEPVPPVLGNHLYIWNTPDSIVTELANRGMRWQPVLAYSALWASSVAGDEHAPPASAADYAAFVGAFAARYGQGGAFWRAHPELVARPVRSFEIWNEEDLNIYWKPTANAAAYADLYAAARAAVHAADPTATAMVGGIGDPYHAPQYVEAMLAHRPDLRGNLDAVGLHPYTASAAASLQLVVNLRRGLQYLGSGDAPIAVTEIGWTTTGANPVTDAYRAAQLSQITRDLARSDCGVSVVDVHTWVTFELTGDAQYGYGIVHPNGSQTASAPAYFAALRAVQDGSAGAPGSLKACWPDAPSPPAPPTSGGSGTGTEGSTSAPSPEPPPAGSSSPPPGAPSSDPPPAPAGSPPASSPVAAPKPPASTPTVKSSKTASKCKPTKAKGKGKAKRCPAKKKKPKAKGKHR